MTGRPIVAYADGHDCAASPPAAFGGEGCSVVLGWMPEDRAWLAGPIRGWALMGGYALGRSIADGRMRYLPTRLSAVPHVLATLQPEVLVIPAVRRGDDLVYGRSVGWAPAAAALAAQVVVEIDEEADDLGAPPITCEITRTVTARRPITPPAPIEAGPADRVIAEQVVALLPPLATLQFGPGSVADAVVRAIDTPVGVWSGLLTDAVAELAAREPAAEPGSRRLRLRRCTPRRPVPRGRCAPDRHRRDARCHVHRAAAGLRRAQHRAPGGPRRLGERGTGAGPPRRRDGRPSGLLRGRRACADGLSVIALHATHRGLSSIVPRVETVSTPRCDVDVVVTEHGVADLRGLDDTERAHRIIEVAAPEHRAELEHALEHKEVDP